MLEKFAKDFIIIEKMIYLFLLKITNLYIDVVIKNSHLISLSNRQYFKIFKINYL